MEIKTFRSIHITLLALLALLVSLTCTLPHLAGSNGAASTTPAPQTAEKPGGPTAPAAAGSTQAELIHPDPLDHLMTLHSIQIDLSITRPDSSSRTTHIDIDPSGNMRIKSTDSAAIPTDLPSDFDPKMIKTATELWVVGGNVYQYNEQDPGWMSSPVGSADPQILFQDLHGIDGPSLWLSLLPPNSIQPAGQETVGGFAADKYAVNGEVENQTITGTLWEEPQSDALVQADLHVPGALLNDPGQSQPGELKIELRAQKADVPVLTLPPAPPPTAVPTAAP